MPAAWEVSLPYAPGITTVLSPKGIESAQRPQRATFLSIGSAMHTPKNISGITRSLIKVKIFLRPLRLILY